MVADIVKPANRKQTKTVNASATTTQYVYPDAGKDLTKVTVNGLTASSALGNATTDDVAEGKTFSSSNGILLTGTGAIIPNVHVYGAEWAGTSDPSWTRTDESANFSDPNPYYSGMSTTPSSPFDGLMPWAGMRRVSDTNAGELVEIPKFWYKCTCDGAKVKLQIADNYKLGFYTSPAHADRGDGIGERDYVYVGRYHCHTSDYKSKTGGKPKASITRSTARSSIHNLGSNIWQMDFATRFTIWLLYIVEFADWNSQAKIGYGCGNNSSAENMGYTDSMTYHTGTTKSNRTTYGVGTQYRHIEGLWDNVCDWLDGCYYNGNGLNIIKNPSNFSDSTGGTAVGTPSFGYPSKFTAKDVAGTFPMFIPSEANGSDSTYSCDFWDFNSWWSPCLCAGGNYYQGQYLGLFYLHCVSSSNADATIGCRLMVLPSSRLL